MVNILEARDLKKYYGKGDTLVKALDGVNLTVADGEFVAIVGTSGSGKSTLLHMLGGLDRPTSGAVTVDGKDYTTSQRLTVTSDRTVMEVNKNYSANLTYTPVPASGDWGVLLSHPQTGHLPPLAVRPAKQFAHRLVSMFPSIGPAPSRAGSLLILRGDSPWQAIISPILYHRPAPNTRKSAKHRKGRYEKPYRPGKFSLVFAKERAA